MVCASLHALQPRTPLDFSCLDGLSFFLRASISARSSLTSTDRVLSLIGFLTGSEQDADSTAETFTVFLGVILLIRSASFNEITMSVWMRSSSSTPGPSRAALMSVRITSLRRPVWKLRLEDSLHTPSLCLSLTKQTKPFL